MMNTLSGYNGVTILRDISYHNDRPLQDNGRHGLPQSQNQLDVYLPNPIQKTICRKNDSVSLPSQLAPPLVVFVHGGGWRRGHRQQWKYFISSADTNPLAALVFRFNNLYENIGRCFAKNGIACAVISYPLMTPSVSVTLVELVNSFLMSSVPLTLVFFLLMLFLHLCLPISNYSLINLTCNQVHPISRSGLTLILSASILLSQFTIWVCVCANIMRYKPKHRTFLTLSTPLALIACMSYFWITTATDFATCLQISSCLLTTVLQLSIGVCQLLFTIHRHGKTKCEDQIRAVARSIQWLKTYRHEASVQPYNLDKIVLAGHSAGAHLINLLVWSGDGFLQEFNLSRNDIKGVISLSGIHNLRTLDFGLPRYLYLSAFGIRHDSDTWAKLSPTKLIAEYHHHHHHHKPQFLIVSAEGDLDFMKKDATDYFGQLSSYGYTVLYKIIPHTNHFNLPMRFGGIHDEGVLVQYCLQFVFDCNTI